MRLFEICLLVLAYSSTIFCNVEKVGSVYQLTDSNYDQFLIDHPIVFMKLYAPWCGHCKHLAPVFSQAAELMEKNENVVFAEIDATTETKIAEQLKIEGYPTVLLFKNGKKIEYDDARTVEAIIKWINIKLKPKIYKINEQKELDALYFNDENNSVSIVYLGYPDGEIYQIFNQQSEEIEQEGLIFIESSSDELIQSYKPKNKLIILKKFDEQRSDLEESNLETGIEKIKVLDFIKWNKTPKVMDLSMKASDAIFNEEQPCLFLFLQQDEQKQEENQKLIEELKIAQRAMDKKIYVTSAFDNNELTQKMMEYLIITKEQLPKVYIIEPKDENIIKYLFKEDTINSDNLIKFFQSYEDNSLQPFYQSQEIPSEPYIENVRQLVGKNFHQFLETEKNKFRLIKFYAQWCPHSQKLAPKFAQLATKLKNVNQKIILAELDATLNELNDQNIEGVPTLILYKPDGTLAEFSEKLTQLDIALFLEKEMGKDWIAIEIDPEIEEEEEGEEENLDMEEQKQDL